MMKYTSVYDGVFMLDSSKFRQEDLGFSIALAKVNSVNRMY